MTLMINFTIFLSVFATYSSICMVQKGHSWDLSILDTSNLQDNNNVERLSNPRGLDIDLNHSPPPSPPIVQVDQQKPKRKVGRKPKYTTEERKRKEKERLFKRVRRYNNKAILHAKNTMKGEKLKEYLEKAYKERIQKRERDIKLREELAQRFLDGTQTSSDIRSRLLAAERAKKSRERKQNNINR